MEWVALAVLVTLSLAVLKLMLSNRQSTHKDSSYQLTEELFTPAEHSFYGVLSQAVEDKAVIFSKVRIADILSPQSGTNRSQWQTAFNCISSKHFDYVICSPDTLHVKAVIELDDNSHSKIKRVERNDFIDAACLSSGLKLHRIKAASSYNLNAIKAMLFPVNIEDTTQDSALATSSKIDQNTTNSVTKASLKSVFSADESKIPLPIASAQTLTNKQSCPNCSSALIRKVAKKGQHKGTVFLACSNSPKCRYIAKAKAVALS